MKERRKHQRMPLAVLLEISSQNTKKSVSKGFITNLSEGGLALETTERLREGETYHILFTLLNGLAFDLSGEVIYTRGGVLTRAYGVRFLKPEPELKSKIKNYITTRVSNGYHH